MSFDGCMRSLAEMNDGWDGRGSLAPTSEAMATAKNFTACALGSGGIQIEIHAGGADVEIEITPAGRIISVMYALAGYK